jgi:hypothetical protein
VSGMVAVLGPFGALPCYIHTYIQRLSRPQGHSAAGSIRQIEKSGDLIGNRIRDIPACSTMPQPTTLPRAPYSNEQEEFKYFHDVTIYTCYQRHLWNKNLIPELKSYKCPWRMSDYIFSCYLPLTNPELR